MTPIALQWLSLVGIIWLQSINGTNSNFPAYSSQLKLLLSISQLQLNNLAFASDAGKLFGWLSGIAADYLPLWLVLIIGSSLGLIGKKYYMISRTAFVVALMAPTGGAFFLLVNTNNLWLYMSTAIIGVCTGAMTSISATLTAELFGTKHFGVNHNVVVVNIPIGSCLFGYLAALVYRKQGAGGSAADGKCFGVDCYRSTFILWGSLCFFGTFLALMLYARTRKFYLYNSQSS
ncbi:Nodulin-like protein [Corchorus capsularis]|uniref:Nodulin-like protein n=1 Tax=Corchorus capsularis TaxID=210143 RepID=A0A1R3IK28_COCAP|nr:Nodulin-like protein [Corchorus capsularis]